MKFIELKNDCIKKTLELIKNHEWITINKILKDSPKQLIDVSKNIEEELLKGYIDKNKIFIRGENRLERPFLICIELIINNERSFTSKFKTLICDKIFPDSENLNEQQLELFVKALGIEIIQQIGEIISEYPRVVKFLINHYPEKIQDFFPIIIDNGWWDLGFLLIHQYPPLLKHYRHEAEKLFMEHNYNRWQYNDMRELLVKNYSDVVDLMDQVRNERRSLFYEKLKTTSDNPEDLSWLYDKQPYFSVGIDLFTDDEIRNIIRIILSLEFYRNHDDKNFYWANWCLIEIGWVKKRNLFEEFIEKLFELDYYQVIGDFFKEFPLKIKDSKDLFLKEPSFIYSDLFKEYFSYFEIVNPSKVFEGWLKKGFPFSHLIAIFYHNYPELENEFTIILENYYNEMNFANPSEDYHSIDLGNILTKVTEGFYPKYSISFLQNKLKEFLSSRENITWFNPYLGTHLANNFNLLEEALQDQILLILLERRLGTLARFLMVNFSNFKKYINKILNYEPKDLQYTRSYVYIIQIIIRKTINETDIFTKCLKKLNSLEDSYEKAQLQSYLGHHEEALNAYTGVIENEITIPSLAYTLIDYKIDYLELNIYTLTMNDFSTLSNEILEILEHFINYNLNQNKKGQFIFKASYYHGRLLLSYGILLINYRSYEEAKDCLDQAYEFLSGLINPKLPQETETIINTYERIASLLIQLIPIIKNNKESHYNRLNSILKVELASIIKNLESTDPKLNRIIEEINLLTFDEKGCLKQLKCDLPASFCPRPPNINRKYLQNEDGDIIYEWNNKNMPKLYYDPIKVSTIWELFNLIIEFADEEITFEYNLDIKHPNFIQSDIKDSEFEKDSINFIFYLKSEIVSGKLEIMLLIKPNDRCVIPLTLKFPIIHLEHTIKAQPEVNHKTIYNEISSGYDELDIEINAILTDLSFWTINISNSGSMLLWIEIIKEFFNILHKCYDYEGFYRKKAQKWIYEKRDMNPWIGGVLKDHFQDKHKDHSSVAGGDADHWIEQIPIEDKLLRSNENLNNDTVIEDKYEKHKNQILKEAGRSSYGVLVIADIRKEIKNGSFIPLPLKKCFKVYYENDTWIIVFLLQAFIKTPSKS